MKDEDYVRLLTEEIARLRKTGKFSLSEAHRVAMGSLLLAKLDEATTLDEVKHLLSRVIIQVFHRGGGR